MLYGYTSSVYMSLKEEQKLAIHAVYDRKLSLCGCLLAFAKVWPSPLIVTTFSSFSSLDVDQVQLYREGRVARN